LDSVDPKSSIRNPQFVWRRTAPAFGGQEW